MRLTGYWLLVAVLFSITLGQNFVTGRLFEGSGTKRLLGQTDSAEESGTRQTIKEKLAALQRKSEELNDEISDLQNELDGADVTDTSTHGDTSERKGVKSSSDYSDGNQRDSGESQDSGWSYSRGSSSHPSSDSAAEGQDAPSRSYSRSDDDSTSSNQGTWRGQSSRAADSSSGYDDRAVDGQRDGQQQVDTSGDAGDTRYTHKTQSSSYARSSNGESDDYARGDGQSTHDTPEDDSYDGSSNVQHGSSSHTSSSYVRSSHGTGGDSAQDTQAEEDYQTAGYNTEDTPPRHSSSSSAYSKGSTTNRDGAGDDSTGNSWSKEPYNTDNDGSEETDGTSTRYSGHGSSSSHVDEEGNTDEGSSGQSERSGHRSRSEDCDQDAGGCEETSDFDAFGTLNSTVGAQDDSSDDVDDTYSFAAQGSDGPEWSNTEDMWANKESEADQASFEESLGLPAWISYHTWTLFGIVVALTGVVVLSWYVCRKAHAAILRSRQDTDINADGVWDWRAHGEGKGEAHATVELLSKVDEVKVEVQEPVWEKPIKKPIRALRKEK